MSFVLPRLCWRCQVATHKSGLSRRLARAHTAVHPSFPQHLYQSRYFATTLPLQLRGDSRAFSRSSQSATLEQPLSALDRSGPAPLKEEPLEWDAASPESAVEIVLPPPTNTKVKTADFVKSSTAISQCPKAGYPEFAVIGRSNVGKSSLINMVTGRKSLAQISKTPGKTVCINHFVINNSWYLVDLPGYGYAKRSKDLRLVWNEFTKDYLLNRDTLVNVLLLVDSSIPPTELDLTCADWLAASQVPFTLVFTKLDKRKKGSSSAQNIEAFKSALQQEWEHLPFVLETSAVKGIGRQEVMAHIASLRTLWQQER